MNTLYLECFSGISGDMAVASLLDLGANQEKLNEVVKSLNFDCKLDIKRTEKNGISALEFNVNKKISNEQKSAKINEHHHVKINDVYSVIDNSKLSVKAKLLAKKIFDIIANAEAKVHNKSRAEVHFHEVGDFDSIVDVCAVAFCLDDLKINKVICSPISEGKGCIKCSHGEIPVPVPATAEIARVYNIPINITDNYGEMLTPTGAAIIVAIVNDFNSPQNITYQKIGIGAGKKDFKQANILRAYIINENIEQQTNDKIIVIETSIDDSTPEELSFCLEKLFELGVRDAFYSPIYMKKNRPGWQLTVMCKSDIEQKAISLIFKHTTAVGVRRQEIERVIMNRKKTIAKTKYGDVDANIFTWKDIKKTCLEYESVKKLAEEKDCNIVDIYRNY